MVTSRTVSCRCRLPLPAAGCRVPLLPVRGAGRAVAAWPMPVSRCAGISVCRYFGVPVCRYFVVVGCLVCGFVFCGFVCCRVDVGAVLVGVSGVLGGGWPVRGAGWCGSGEGQGGRGVRAGGDARVELRPVFFGSGCGGAGGRVSRLVACPCGEWPGFPGFGHRLWVSFTGCVRSGWVAGRAYACCTAHTRTDPH